jgi:hypothetical protein
VLLLIDSAALPIERAVLSVESALFDVEESLARDAANFEKKNLDFV